MLWCIWGYELSNEYHLLALQSDESLIVESIRSCLVKRFHMDIQLVQVTRMLRIVHVDVKGYVLGVSRILVQKMQW